MSCLAKDPRIAPVGARLSRRLARSRIERVDPGHGTGLVGAAPARGASRAVV